MRAGKKEIWSKIKEKDWIKEADITRDQRKKVKLTERKRRKWEKAETSAINGEFEDPKTSSSEDKEDDIKKEMTNRKEKAGLLQSLLKESSDEEDISEEETDERTPSSSMSTWKTI